MLMLYASNLNKYGTNKWLFTTSRYGTSILSNLAYSGQVIDLAGNTSGSETRTILKDTVAPTLPSLVSPTSGTYLNTGTALLRRGTSTDTGVGLSGYIRQVSTGSAFTTIYLSGNTSNTGINIFTMPDNIYYRRAQGVDLNGNTGVWSSGWIFTVDTTLPTITFT